MKSGLILLMMALVLSACGSAGQAKLQGLCTGMLEADTDLTTKLVGVRARVKPFCQCYAQTAAADGEETLALHLRVWSALSDIHVETGQTDLEALADALKDELRAVVVTGRKFGFDEEAFEGVGDYVNAVSGRLDESGTCGS